MVVLVLMAIMCAACGDSGPAEPVSIGPGVAIDEGVDCPAGEGSRTFDANGTSVSVEVELQRAVDEYDLPGGEWNVASRTDDGLHLVSLDPSGAPTVIISIGITPFNDLWATLGLRFCDR